MENKAKQAFFHHLYDTLVLLGVELRFADLIEYPEDITSKDVDDLIRFNGKLIDETKTKLVNLNVLAIEVIN